MTARSKHHLPIFFISLGLISFAHHGGIGSFLMLLCGGVSLFILAAGWRLRRPLWSLLWPFSSGLLLFAARFFYWDRWDFSARVDNLLLLSLTFSLFLAWREFRLGRRFLFWFRSLTPRRRAVFIFLLAELVFVLSSAVLVHRGIQWVGDEAHYLVIAQSIAQDGDLNVFDQYARDRYREFVEYRLLAHAKVGRGFKKWYSFHLPGLALTLTPFFLFKIPIPLLYFLIRCYLGIFGSLLAVLVYRFALRLWKRKNLALYVALIFIFTSPVFFMSFHIFAEVQALLLILYSLYLTVGVKEKKGIHVFLAGLFLGLTVFWGMKYLIFIVLFCLGFGIYFLRRRRWTLAGLYVASPLLFLALFFLYLFLAYGSFSPMSVYTGVLTEAQKAEYYSGVAQTGWKIRVETLLGYFLDQRDGLLLYNPFYFFFFPGLVLALRRFKKFYPYLLAALPGFVYLLYHGYSTVRPGVCPQARYLVPVIWILMLFSVLYYLHSGNRSFRAVWRYLPGFSLFVAVYQLFHPLTIYQTTTHDYLLRPGLLFQQWSNLIIDLPRLLPSFIKVDHNESYLPNILSILVLAILVFLSLRRTAPRGGRCGWLWVGPFLLFFVIFVLFPRIPLHHPLKINKSDALPHVIHGRAPYPSQAAEKWFEFRGEGPMRVTASTFKPSGLWTLTIRNHGARDLRVAIHAFDRELARLTVAPNRETRLALKDPGSRTIRGRPLYQFTLLVEGESAAGELEIFPNRRLGR